MSDRTVTTRRPRRRAIGAFDRCGSVGYIEGVADAGRLVRGRPAPALGAPTCRRAHVPGRFHCVEDRMGEEGLTCSAAS
jgi:hypothetical protein